MGRTKGTKNRVGHRAGGSRKGAGRKPRVMVNDDRPPSTGVVERLRENVGDQPMSPSSPSGSSVAYDLPGTPEAVPIIPSINCNFIDVHERHTSLGLYPNTRHHVHPVTPISDSQIHASVSPSTSLPPQLSQLVWNSVPCEPPPMGCNNSSPVPSHSSYDLRSPAQFSAPFECRYPSYLSAVSSSGCSEIEPNPPLESSTSQDYHPLNVDKLPAVDQDMSSEYTQCYLPPLCSSETRMDSQSSDFYNSNIAVPPCDPALSLLPTSQLPTSASVSASRAVVARDTFVRIAPAPSSHEQRTGMLPNPLFPSITPVHCLAILSQTPPDKRRRRRCVVCLQLGREEASYECPGRGDRTRCSSRRGDGEERIISEPKKRRCDWKTKHRNKARSSTSSGFVSTPPIIGDRDGATYAPYTSQPITDTVEPKAVLTTHILYPHIATQPCVSLVPYGHPMEPSPQFVLDPAENAKRRSRRCMVCVTKNKDGTRCPGRGNRTLCPNREGGMGPLDKE